MSDFQALILAAGHGSRMKSETIKVLHPIMGAPMLSLVIDAVKSAGMVRPAVVVGYQAQQVMDVIGDRVEYIYQDEQLGTGHAVMVSMDRLDDCENVLVLFGDTPLVTDAMLKRLVRQHRESGAAATLLTAVVDDPAGLGRVVRDESGELVSIVEEADASHAEAAIREINTAIACFRMKALAEVLPLLGTDNVQKEYYLPDVFPLLRERDLTVQTVQVTDAQSVIGVNTRQALAEVTEVFRLRILDELMSRGVTVLDPASTWVYPEVEVQPDTVIHPFTTLQGSCRIGSHCEIGPMAHLINSRVDDEARIWYSVLTDAHVGTASTVGPFSHLRPGTRLEADVKVGNFAEIKNSQIGTGTKVPHHSYVGDSDIGRNVNVGAGSVTVNYDGRDKHRTVLEDDVFLGCNSNLIAPLTISRGAVVAAGSTLDQDVPADSLAVARSRQQNKEGWVLRRWAQQGEEGESADE